MKIEIEIPDLENYWFGDDYEPTVEEIRDKFIDDAIDHFAEKMYDEVESTRVFSEKISRLIESNKETIIDRVTDRVTEKILMTRAVKEQMPKKSEIAGINKEWEQYFLELIDKAIAKRFK